MENLLAIIGIAALIVYSVKLFKFVKHKVWLYVLGFFLSGFIISLFLFGFVFFTSTEFIGEMVWAFSGLLAIITYDKYSKRKDKKKKKDKKSWNTIIFYIILLCIILFLPPIYDSYKEITCKSPKIYTLGVCCVPDETGFFCEEHIDTVLNELNQSIENEVVTENTVSDDKYPFYIEFKDGYYLMTDIEIVGIPINYYLMAFGVEEEDFVEMKVMYNEYNIISEYDLYIELKTGLEKGLTKMNGKILNETTIVNEKGIEGYFIESYHIVDGLKINTEVVIFMNALEDYYVFLTYSSTENYMGYITDFYSMVNSFEYKVI